MKPGTKHTSAALAAGIVAVAQCAFGQSVEITSFGKNGVLTANGLAPGSTAAVEWASSIDGEWSSDWAALTDIMVEQDGSLETAVPMFFRVRGVPANPDPEGLAWIPPGVFTMGSPESEAERERWWEEFGIDETQHPVTISSGFWMGRFEVTQSEYVEVMGSNPSFWVGDDRPVESLTWFQARDYCIALTERERAAGRLPERYIYRLPTEAEWEYACRAGTTTAFHYGSELRSGMANFNGTVEYSASVGRIDNPGGVWLGDTTPVGSFESNTWGLYDMHGNVWEWCYDWVDRYPAGSVTDPKGPEAGLTRVTRGGSCRGQWGAYNCRSAMREFRFPDSIPANGQQGFRVVLGKPIE